jgi:hypothetical protein
MRCTRALSSTITILMTERSSLHLEQSLAWVPRSYGSLKERLCSRTHFLTRKDAVRCPLLQPEIQLCSRVLKASPFSGSSSILGEPLGLSSLWI